MDNSASPIEVKKTTFIKKVFRFFLWLMLALLVSLITLSGLLYFYRDKVKEAIVAELNKHLTTSIYVAPENIDLTIFSSFPDASLNFKMISAVEKANSTSPDSLFTAGLFGLRFNIWDIVDKKYNINKILIQDASLKLKVDKNGEANYNIWKSDTSSKKENKAVNFNLENIRLENVIVHYLNKKDKIKLQNHIISSTIKGHFNEEKYTLSGEGNCRLVELKFAGGFKLNDKKLRFDLRFDVDKNKYNIKKGSMKLNELDLDCKGSLVDQDTCYQSDLIFDAKNLEIKALLSLLPEKQQRYIKDYESDGLFYAKGSIKGLISENTAPFMNIDFGIDNAVITYLPKKVKLNNVNLTGNYSNLNEEILTLKNLSAAMMNSKVEGNCEIINLNNPYINLHVKAQIEASEAVAFLPLDTIKEVSGNIALEAFLKGNTNEIIKNYAAGNHSSEGKLEVNKLRFKFKGDERWHQLNNGNLILNGNNLSSDSLEIQSGNTQLVVKAELNNVIAWVFNKTQTLKGNAQLIADKLMLDEWLNPSENSHGSTNSALYVPDNLVMNIEVRAGLVQLGKFKAENLKGVLLLKDKIVLTENIQFNSFDGSINLSGMIDARGSVLVVKGTSNYESISIKDLFFQLNNFGQNDLTSEHLNGKASGKIAFNSSWDARLNCIEESVWAESETTIENGELKNYKPLEALSKYIELSELKNIRFNTLTCKVNVKDKIIYIPKTSIQNSAINIDINGKQGFDNSIDYNIKILLSELLAKKPGKKKELDEELAYVENDPENKRCVFLHISGTIENPIIKYDRKGMKQKIKEDLKEEKQNLKSILKEEFGWFKKDSTLTSQKEKEENKKSNQTFKIETSNKKKSKSETELDDEDF